MTPYPCTRARVLAAVAALGGSALLAPASPASAAGVAFAQMWMPSRTATSAKVCAYGTTQDGAPVLGVWTFRVVGPTVQHHTERTGATFAQTCTTVTTNGLATGTADAALTFVAAGTEVTAECRMVLVWAPGVPINSAGGYCTDSVVRRH